MEKTMGKLTVIVPCYNEEESLPGFFREIRKICDQLKQFQFELLFVDDGSRDRTLELLRKEAERDKQVRFLSFSRNFGKEAAIYAGLEHATGDYVAMMDADLQDPPSLLPEMVEALESGQYDCAAARRVDRKGEPPIRSLFARLFYRLINMVSPDVNIVDGARDFRLMSRKMVEAVLSLKEYNRFSKGIFGWVGFRTKWISFENVERMAGETKWSFWKLFLYSLEGIVAFTTAPLSIAAVIGLVCCFVAFFMILVVIGKTLILGDPVGGWPSLACIILMLGGLQLLCMGIIGRYLAKAYLEIKHRPIYLIGETEADGNRGTKEEGKLRGKEYGD